LEATEISANDPAVMKSETAQPAMKPSGRGSYLRGLLKYFGPALIVSVAYIDPGNFGTDIEGGASYGYDLLWVLWLASIMAMVLQYLSGKLGIATGRSLAELMRERLGSKWRIIAYWLGYVKLSLSSQT